MCASEKGWTNPRDFAAITDGEVHVWRASLSSQTVDCHAEDVRSLSSDELLRAGRFRFDRDRRNYVRSRRALRTVLGGYLGLAPSAVVFEYGQCGRPAIRRESRNGIDFNVSHSDGLWVAAIALRRRVGIDVESKGAAVGDEVSLAARFFTPQEAAKIGAQQGRARSESFLACWTRKEAYVKAVGVGLSCELDQFEVSATHDEEPALLSVQGDPGEASRWRMEALSVGAGFIGTLVAEGFDWEPRWFDLHADQ